MISSFEISTASPTTTINKLYFICDLKKNDTFKGAIFFTIFFSPKLLTLFIVIVTLVLS